MAIRLLKEYGHEVKAFGLKSGEIGSIKIEIDINKLQEEFHTITLYLNPTNQKLFYSFIIALKPKRVVFNPGTENEDFQNLLDEARISWEESCTLVMLKTGQY